MPIQSSNPPQLLTLEGWEGLNQQVPRTSIGDQEAFWNENFFPIAPGSLRTCWGGGPALYTAPAGTTILRIFFGFYGKGTPPFGAPPPGRMGWMFLSNGNVDEVDLDTGQVTTLPGIWQPVAPYYWASAKVWRPRWVGHTAGETGGVLFGSPAGLYAWDGTTLSPPGATAPDWLTDLTTGVDPPVPMPVGLPGIYAMEVWQERLWVAGKDVISFSAPSNGADFSTAAGGGSFGYFGDKLVYSYMDLAASAGYLTCFGDSTTDLITNVQLSGSGTSTSPFTTNFNYTNVDPQVGHGFPRPVGRWGRYFIMCNGAPLRGPNTDPLAHRGGIYLLTGGENRNIGEKVTKIYTTVDVSSYYPTFAPATMFGFRVMLLNGRFTDPWGVTRSMLLMYHGATRGREVWSVASQNLDLTHIGTYEQDSVLTPYGTDGRSLYQLFARPDALLRKYLATKAYRGAELGQLTIKNFKRTYVELHDLSGGGVAMTGKVTTRGGGIPNGVQDVGFQLTEGQIYGIEPQALSGAGIVGSLDLESISPDFILERLHVAAEERTLFGA